MYCIFRKTSLKVSFRLSRPISSFLTELHRNSSHAVYSMPSMPISIGPKYFIYNNRVSSFCSFKEVPEMLEESKLFKESRSLLPLENSSSKNDFVDALSNLAASDDNEGLHEIIFSKLEIYLPIMDLSDISSVLRSLNKLGLAARGDDKHKTIAIVRLITNYVTKTRDTESFEINEGIVYLSRLSWLNIDLVDFTVPSIDFIVALMCKLLINANANEAGRILRSTAIIGVKKIHLNQYQIKSIFEILSKKNIIDLCVTRFIDLVMRLGEMGFEFSLLPQWLLKTIQSGLVKGAPQIKSRTTARKVQNVFELMGSASVKLNNSTEQVINAALAKIDRSEETKAIMTIMFHNIAIVTRVIEKRSKTDRSTNAILETLLNTVIDCYRQQQ